MRKVMRLLMFRLAVLTTVLALPGVAQSQFTYTTNNGTITITGFSGVGGAVTIPSAVDGLAVTSIGDNAFYFCTNLTSVTIPNRVTSIGSQAFSSCYSLTNVTIGNSVTSIGFDAFLQCTSLASVTIPDSVTTIGGSAFSGCPSVTSVTLGNSVATIGDSAFWNCTGLTSVTIPNTVTSLAQSAFTDCTSLTAITVAPSNPVYSSIAGVVFNRSQTTLLLCPGGKAGTYVIPDSVTSIGDWAFSWCNLLTNVMMGNSVTNVGSYAFELCYGLASVTIPNSVGSIGSEAFENCASLSSVTIPGSVTSIGEAAFSQCGLTSITIPKSVASIGALTFLDCASLTNVFFQGNAPSHGDDVFLKLLGGGLSDPATVYYLPGTTGWGATFAGRPAVLWNPQMQTTDASFGVRTDQFGFTITGASNLVIVVEASTSLASPAWSPLATNTLTSGSAYFSDPQWTNYPARFYRLRWP